MKSIANKTEGRYFRATSNSKWLKFMAKSINWTTEIEELNSMITMRNGLCVLACFFLLLAETD
jgi:hypothetical protein